MTLIIILFITSVIIAIAIYLSTKNNIKIINEIIDKFEKTNTEVKMHKKYLDKIDLLKDDINKS